MAAWHDAEGWAALLSGASCPLCRDTETGVIAELAASRVVVRADVPVPGYCCVVSRRHVVELFELEDTEAAALMEDIRRAAAAVQRVTGAVKINYEVLGNMVPHLHVHIVPRHRNDVLERTGQRFNAVSAAAADPAELERFAERLRAALA